VIIIKEDLSKMFLIKTGFTVQEHILDPILCILMKDMLTLHSKKLMKPKLELLLELLRNPEPLNPRLITMTTTKFHSEPINLCIHEEINICRRE
jgi:hypothetical protein